MKPLRDVLRLVVLMGIAPLVPACDGGRKAPALIYLDPSEHRVAIRAELLKKTQLGESSAGVLHFIQEQLEPRPGAEPPRLEDGPATGGAVATSSRSGVKHIRLVLGRYMASPVLLSLEIPLFVLTTTSVQWAFDKDDKLIEIFVDKIEEPDSR